MPSYTFKAVDEAGKPQQGTITAASEKEASERIKSQGYFPSEIRAQKVKKKGGGPAPQPGGKPAKKGGGGGAIIFPWTKVKTKQLTVFTRQLSTLQDAGLPILRSLSILEQQQKPGLLKNVLVDVHDDVSSGSSLSDAMNRHPKAFDKLYTKMIAAGEVGGVLDLILQRLSEFMEKAQRLKKRILSAMIYPSAVIGVATVIVLGIMLFIVPSFIAIFEDFDTEMPVVTVVLIEIAKWLAGPILSDDIRGDMPFPGVILLVGVPFLIFFGMKLIRSTAVGKSLTDTIVLRVPILGMLIRKITIAKFARTLGTLVNAGVPILDAINITAETTANQVYRNALNDVHASVRQGDSFAEPLRRAKVCDPIVVNMIDVGEETGDLDKMLLKVADNYDEEVDVAVAGLVSLLEPVMVVVLGVIVGGIVIALFLPLINLMMNLM